MRVAVKPRDAALISVLAYAGLRPQEALALQCGGMWTKTTYDNWRKRAFDRAR